MAESKVKGLRSSWLVQIFTINAALINLCGVAAVSCVVASARMIEKQFGFTGTQTSLILIADEFSGFAALVFGYLGGKFHKPRFQGVLVICLGLSYIIITVPYYIGAASRDTMSNMISSNETTTSTKLPDIVCKKSTDNSSCLMDKRLNNATGEQTVNDQNMFYVFVIGKVLQGAFSKTVYALPYAYLNENCITSSSTFFGGMCTNISHY